VSEDKYFTDFSIYEKIRVAKGRMKLKTPDNSPGFDNQIVGIAKFL